MRDIYMYYIYYIYIILYICAYQPAGVVVAFVARHYLINKKTKKKKQTWKIMPAKILKMKVKASTATTTMVLKMCEKV